MQANPFLATGTRSVGFSIEFGLPELPDSLFRFVFVSVISGYNLRQILFRVAAFKILIFTTDIGVIVLFELYLARFRIGQ